MADLFAAKDAAGVTVEILTDEVTDGTLGTGQKQLIGIVDATINGTNKLVVDASGRAKVDASGVAVPVTDNAGSLTVDDGGGSLTVDGSVSVSGSVTADTELTTADLDTGAGTDTKAVVGLALAASGGAVLAGAANPVPISDNAGSLTVDGTVAVSGVSGVVHVDDNSSTISVDDGAGSLTVDGSVSLAAAIPAGSNAIGTVGVTSLPAADRSTDTLAATLSSDGIATGSLATSDLTIHTPKFAPITASASGATTIIALVASKKLRILGGFIVCAGAVSVNFQSHTTTTTKTGTMPFASNGGIAIPFSPVGWFETVAGEALDINLGGAVAVGGQVVYIEV